ncbi:flavin reductase family protein [Clostridium sp. CX1]|uniref:Flavin reductase family protein n=1 Tax=Clostridium tanneri TaxID=3037988 RepID=A0ABU4JSQ8_9CLOT|nr:MULTISPECIES: flavin reductase family protein [unclassified Clostridium]MCT8976945.1 flavin reductase family protein [Clostridium sp. CX1]MDW8801153.1 flavin reductase family protein [Clostridium sp. A1-XYC3]
MDFTKNLEKNMEFLHKKGAFLTTKVGDEVNTMTISWGSIGFIWGKPMFTALVRKSRHTYNLLEKAGEFTVSIPLDDSMKKELALCGTKSGRDMNKIKEANLKLEEGRSLSTPVIKGSKVHFECKVVYKQPMTPNLLDEAVDNNSYGTKDYHTIYFGEIIDCYEE